MLFCKSHPSVHTEGGGEVKTFLPDAPVPSRPLPIHSIADFERGVVNQSDHISERVFNGGRHQLTSDIERLFVLRGPECDQAVVFGLDVVHTPMT